MRRRCFCVADVPIVPVFHLGAAVGEDIPFWDQRDEFGDTNLLVVKPEEGAIFMCQNAQYQLQAHLLGKVVSLSSGETRLAGSINAMPNVVDRTWEYWTMRLADAGRLPDG